MSLKPVSYTHLAKEKGITLKVLKDLQKEYQNKNNTKSAGYPQAALFEMCIRDRSKALTYGSYTIKEIVAPEGYVLSTRTYNATIKTEDQNSQVTVEDKPIEGYIQVVKKDSKSGKTIVKAHTVFEVYRASDDSFIDTITTNSAGKAKKMCIRDRYTACRCFSFG